MAQDDAKFSIGINITNNIYNLAFKNYHDNIGYSIDPVAMYSLNNRTYIKTELGISKTSSENNLSILRPDYQKIDYINKGFYTRIGVYYDIAQEHTFFRNAFGLNLVYSKFDEYNTFTIKGNNFGDYTGSYNVLNNQLLFIEPSFDIILFKKKYFKILFSSSFPFLVYKNFEKKYPTFYIPGIGNTNETKLYNLKVWAYHFNFKILFPIAHK
jgi:hypothetical protein